MKRKEELLYLSVLLVIYFLLSIPILNLPGVSIEESFPVMNAASIVKGHGPWGQFIRLFDKDILVMTNHHVGIIGSLVYIPSFFIFGVNVYTMRITRILTGALCLFLTYYFARLYFGRKTALISSLLLATFPFFIFLFRHGYLDDGLNPILMLLFLIFIFKFNEKKNSFFLYISFFILGTGLSNKLNFLWFIIAVAVGLFVYRKNFDLTYISKKHILFALVFFVWGALPIIAYNLYIPIWNTPDNNTIEEIFERIVYPKYSGNNLMILNSISEKITELKYIFNNDCDDKIRYSNFIYFPFFIAVSLFFILFNLRKNKDKKRILFFLFIIIEIFLMSLFTITVLRPEHMMIIIPLMLILFAKFLTDIFQKKVILYLILGIITCGNIITLASTYNTFEKFGNMPENQYGGWYQPSDAIYTLVEYLLEKNITNLNGIGPGFGSNAWLLSNMQLSNDMCESRFGNEFEDCIKINSTNYYVLKMDTNAFYWYERFRRLLIENNKTADVKEVFYRRDGLPDFLLAKVNEGIYDNNSILDNYVKQIYEYP